MRQEGILRTFDFEKGFGYIEALNEFERRPIFANYSEFVNGGANITQENSMVRFTLLYTPDGDPVAKLIEVV
jgi:cold shock CspA family protein